MKNSTGRRVQVLAIAVLVGSFALLAEAQQKSNVDVVNQSKWSILNFYLVPVGSTEWGPDQLGATQVINTGDSFTLTDIPCATYHVRLVDQDKDACVVENVDICAGAQQWVITDQDLLACQGTLASGVSVVNQSAWAIVNFYLTPVGSDAWGPDQLGATQVINTGGSFKLSDIPCGNYHVRLVDEDGDACVVENVDICSSEDQWVITSNDLLACQNQ